MNVGDLPVYGALSVAGVAFTALVWSRMSRRGGAHDPRLTLIYFAALVGALAGAKLAFLLAEGATYAHSWIALLSGRSITGGLLGGYAAVEVAKWKLGYRAVTGDVFAVLVPFAIALGRVGCLHAGCCPGVPCAEAWWTIADADGASRWPAATIELAFNVGFLGWVALASTRRWCVGNRFHVYLIAYGLFRFAHEFARDDTRWFGPIGGYHLVALALAGLGAIRFAQRLLRSRSTSLPDDARSSRWSTAPGRSASCR